ADFNGSDSFVISADDGTGNVVDKTINVTVSPEEDTPVFTSSGTLTLDEDNSAVYYSAATDADGDYLYYSLKTGVLHGTIQDIGGGVFKYTPDANFNGSDSFVITVDDGNGNKV
ncbi:MAG TPA: hypothetical protein DHM44_07425, partial [Flexistipes sinusarabici]|nr:hypothetical protein [Flexistipes sinusarabici]